MDKELKARLVKQSEEFIKDWKARGKPEFTDEEIDNFFLDPDLVPELGKNAQWKGITVPLIDCLNIKYITVDRILSEKNMEVRRLLISFMGVETFLREGGSQNVTKQDKRGYQIVKIPVDDNSWYFLKMVNSTLEPKGTSVTREGVIGGKINSDGYKVYFLRLPQTIVHKKLTNEEAVAWSFGLKPKPGAIYSNQVNTFLEKSKSASYDFKQDRRSFTTQGRQGDVLIRLLATSMENLAMGNLYRDNGYDPSLYSPETES